MIQIPSGGIWKGPDCPAGHEYYAPVDSSHLPDCPRCKYGTPRETGNGYRCADCGYVLTQSEVEVIRQKKP